MNSGLHCYGFLALHTVLCGLRHDTKTGEANALCNLASSALKAELIPSGGVRDGERNLNGLCFINLMDQLSVGGVQTVFELQESFPHLIGRKIGIAFG